ncbi:hypothetical protein L484_002119 [Morus notabilis]|uniref:NHL domain-containing protein n=1 Tax=Morus notabilis TaxID=981085 RepID=W9RWT7_9ROSA|nr:uncharacterized protein LOC21385699 [Morus notabilis]EXC16035.1 hypothetical protein L484_002119 [Morus notabilis]
MAVQDPEMNRRDDPESFGEGRSNALLANTRCGFCFPCIGSRRSSAAVGLAWWERIQTAQGDHWWNRGIRAFKKLREWSEIVAGPKWKTFIRRFNRNRSGGNRHGKFQYDPLSYSLNFDEGLVHNGNSEEDDYAGFRDFSTRYGTVSGPPPVQPVAIGPRSNDVAVFA